MLLWLEDAAGTWAGFEIKRNWYLTLFHETAPYRELFFFCINSYSLFHTIAALLVLHLKTLFLCSLLCHSFTTCLSSCQSCLCVCWERWAVMAATLHRATNNNTLRLLFFSSAFRLRLPLSSAELCPVTVVWMPKDIPPLTRGGQEGSSDGRRSLIKSDLFSQTRILRIVSLTEIHVDRM